MSHWFRALWSVGRFLLGLVGFAALMFALLHFVGPVIYAWLVGSGILIAALYVTAQSHKDADQAREKKLADYAEREATSARAGAENAPTYSRMRATRGGDGV